MAQEEFENLPVEGQEEEKNKKKKSGCLIAVIVALDSQNCLSFRFRFQDSCLLFRFRFQNSRLFFRFRFQDLTFLFTFRNQNTAAGRLEIFPMLVLFSVNTWKK